MGQSQQTVVVRETLSQFVYELLDAHDDTMRLAEEQVGDIRWDAHVDYLRSLQRVGRELLAHQG
jgi:hypothetical protein